MKHAFKKIIAAIMVLLFVLLNISDTAIKAEESIEDGGISVFSLGEDGEAIMVRGNEDTVGDYGDVAGYEITSAQGTNHVEYRDMLHHCMNVTTSEGITVGYCMQPYMNGPSIDSYNDYNYIEGLSNSSIFSAISEQESDRWKAAYVVGTRYGFGGTMADPNHSEGRNIHDGGTFGTYIVKSGDGVKAVRGLMIGGKVYEMTSGEAKALTQVVVHYIANRGSLKTITDFKGHTNPGTTSEAYNHMADYAYFAGINFDNGKSLREVAQYYDANTILNAYQSIKWEIYDSNTKSWKEFNGESLGAEHMDSEAKVKLRVNYYSKNMCNKLLYNTSTNNVAVIHDYSPFVVETVKSGSDYYDYITVNNKGSIPIKVTYDKVTAGKESVTDNTIAGRKYDIDTFSQRAIIEIDGEKLLASDEGISLNVATGVGAAAAPCFDDSTSRYSARMFSCKDVQDCLMIASNENVDISSDITVRLAVDGSIRVKKVSAEPEITDNNSCYDFTGAKYNVYAVSSDKDTGKANLVGTFITNADGIGIVSYSKYNSADEGEISETSKNQLNNLPLGWYMVCEESGPTNDSYKIDTRKYYVNINSDNYKEVKDVVSEEYPNADPIPFEIVKKGIDGDKVGKSSLEGAEFTVYYYKGYYDSYQDIISANVSYDRRWIFETRISASTNNATCLIHEELLLEGSDEPYLSDKGSMILPLGTIVVMETKAPEGYTLEDAKYSIVNTIDGTSTPIECPYVSKVVMNAGTIKLSVANNIVVDETNIRGDLMFIKKDGDTGEPMAGIPFLITSKTTGESHIIVTDKDGIATTSASKILHSDKTNGNDSYDENQALEPTGVWFSGGDNIVEVNDLRGALPYDDYVVKELPCKANSDYVLSRPFEISVEKQNELVEYGEVVNEHMPMIKTSLFDAIDGDKIVSADGNADISLLDRVSYEYLDTDKTYVLKGVIIDKSTKQAVKLKDGTTESYVEFKPEEKTGTVDVPFEFTINIKSGELVAYEYLYEKGKDVVVASHEDIDSAQQTVAVELIITTEVTTEETTETAETTETTEVTTEETTETTEMTTEQASEITTTELTTEESNTAVKGEVREDFTPKTGDSSKLHITIILMVLAMAGTVGMICAKRKTHNSN